MHLKKQPPDHQSAPQSPTMPSSQDAPPADLINIDKDNKRSRMVAEEIERLHQMSVVNGKRLENEDEIMVPLSENPGGIPQGKTARDSGRD